MPTPIQDVVIQAFADAAKPFTLAAQDLRSATAALAAAPFSPYLTPPMAGAPASTSKSTAGSAAQGGATAAGLIDGLLYGPAFKAVEDQQAKQGKSTAAKILDYVPLSPVIKGLIGLFTGGESDTPPPLIKYAMPASVSIQAAERGGQLYSADYDQAGQARAFTPAAAAIAPGGAATINLTINALDARSILDRAPELASAVRTAMLDSHAINDTIGEVG